MFKSEDCIPHLLVNYFDENKNQIGFLNKVGVIRRDTIEDDCNSTKIFNFLNEETTLLLANDKLEVLNRKASFLPFEAGMFCFDIFHLYLLYFKKNYLF